MRQTVLGVRHTVYAALRDCLSRSVDLAGHNSSSRYIVGNDEVAAYWMQSCCCVLSAFRSRHALALVQIPATKVMHFLPQVSCC